MLGSVSLPLLFSFILISVFYILYDFLFYFFLCFAFCLVTYSAADWDLFDIHLYLQIKMAVNLHH